MYTKDNSSSYHPVLLMENSTTKRVQQIVAGDILMDITGNPVRVTNCERIDSTVIEEQPSIQIYQLNLALIIDPLIITENQPVFVRNTVPPHVHLKEEETKLSTIACIISTAKRLNHEGFTSHQGFEYMVRKKRPFKPPRNGQTPEKEIFRVIKPDTMRQDYAWTW